MRCGASARARAQFCRQCGEPVGLRAGEGAAGTTVVPASASAQSQPPDTNAGDVSSRNTAPENVLDQKAAREGEAIRVKRVSPPTPESARRRVIVAAAGGARRELDVAEDQNRRRAQRGERAAVLDEAAVDPSLRFVLVAGLIFAVALVVLVLSLALR